MLYNDARAHYQIMSAGADMADLADLFYGFTLEKPINCAEQAFAIMVEQ